MTPKEKANKLVEKYYMQFGISYRQAKQCALIAVDEIIKALKDIAEIVPIKSAVDFYEEVKIEIINL